MKLEKLLIDYMVTLCRQIKYIGLKIIYNVKFIDVCSRIKYAVRINVATYDILEIN